MHEKAPEEHALFFFDGIDHATNRKIAVSFNNFMRRHHWGKSCTNILTTPFFCDSEVSPGIQISDVVAYCVNQRYVGRRGYIESYFKMFRELSFTYEDPDEGYNMWGFQLIPSEEAVAASPEEFEDH
jgi:hypothetical protein